MHQVHGTTKILGVMGYPVEHSLSPVMHNAAIAAMGLDYVYIPLPVEISNLAAAVAGLKAIGAVEGFNLTIPHKQEIMPLLDKVTDTAQAVGAVNTVKRIGNSWVGTNTDVAGFLTPLLELDRNWQQTPVVVLGSGGAARAVVAGCLQLRCPVVHVVGRDLKKMKRFYAEMTAQLQNYSIRVHSWEAVANLLEVAGLVVNTTPVGMSADPNSPVTEEQMSCLPHGAIVYDLIYTPRPTKFLRMASQRGLTSIDGLEMLLNQGAIALEFWLDRPVPMQVMQEALLQRLDA